MKKSGVKKSGAFWHVLSLCALLGGMSSCVSTEPVEPSSDTAGEKVPLVLNIKMDEDVSTRAEANHSGYKLRYIALMFENSLGNLGSIKERREMIDTGDANQMVFYVDPNQTYSFLLYADYIPSDTQKNSDNEYGDYFYDTHTNKEMVTMLTTPKGNFSDVTVDFFNNDNYDFFAGSLQLVKRDEAITKDVVLKRRVAKVRFVDNSTNSGVYSVSVSSFKHIRNFSIGDGTTGATQLTPHNQELVVSPNKYISNNGDKEVLFFYTFADEYADNSLISVTMNVTEADNTVSQKIEANSIPLQMNYITTVKGKLLPDASGSNTPGSNDSPGSDNPGIGGDTPGTGGDTPGTGDNENPGGDDTPGSDTPADPSLEPIYLNLSLSDDWYSPSYEVSQ